MAMKTEHLHSPNLATDRIHEPIGARIVPVPDDRSAMSAQPAPSDAMEVESPSSNSPTNNNSPPEAGPDSEKNGKASAQANENSPPDTTGSGSGTMPAPSAAGAAQQPKIVQTAFIHKLYNMLEDTSIQHLISWSSTAESFVMSPTADFSKVLAQYFKHTNISSFVRQLNMYGFHKERDVFHTGNPDTTLWEFKHGNGNFKRGDLASLREIKRRASKHTPIHKESAYVKSNPSQPGTPAEPMPMPPETTEARVANLEHSLYEMASRLHRSEENVHYLQSKAQAAMDTLSRVLHFNQELTRSLLSLAPTDSPVHRDVLTLQGMIQRQADVVRNYDEQHDAPYIQSSRSYFGGVENAPVSPRQLPQDDSRRLGPGIQQMRGQPSYRPLVSSNLSSGSRRPYGSIGGTSPNQSSPLRNAAPPPPPLGPHLLPPAAEALASSTGRRHTSADIRAHGWQPAPSPFSSNPPSAAWPSSPSRVPPEDQRLRESLSSYSLQTASHSHPQSRPTTPPPPIANGAGHGGDPFSSWTWNSAGSRDSKALAFKDSSAPPTRRGSMAHILNPSEAGARDDDDDDARGDEDRKRKRLQ